MIVKPCPECGDENAACSCVPYFETECKGCGETTFGRTPPETCHKCGEWYPWEDV